LKIRSPIFHHPVFREKGQNGEGDLHINFGQQIGNGLDLVRLDDPQ